ncbi:MAG: ERV1/ALR-related protein [Tepidisphaeraceae bacterium]
MSLPLPIACRHWSPAGPHTGLCDLRPATRAGPRPPRAWCARLCPHHSPPRIERAKAPPLKAPPLPAPVAAEPARRGAELWGELHRWALSCDPTHASNWLGQFALRIPCGDCRRHWLDLVREIPPFFSTADEAFAWTVTLHNRINAQLGKPALLLADARQRWTAQVANYFDAVWCINLDRDQERWQTFQRSLDICQWPFGPVTRVSAIHGDTVGIPDHFHQGGGAWGCLQSHLRILEQSLMAGHERILVMEDDVDLRPDFGKRARAFLTNLGDETWDCLMFGGQHMSPPTPFKPGVVRAANIQRTHCMALSRTFMRELYRHWSSPLDKHCDWALGPFAARWKTFAPESFIAGQRGGHSWITGSDKPPEWWNPPPPDAPVIYLRCPRAVLDECRDLYHAGNRRNSDGVCVGLADVFDSRKHPTSQQKIAALKDWISMIQWEVASRRDASVCTIWHPQADGDIVKAAAGNVLIEISADTLSDARQRRAAVRSARQTR